ncbi:hypothetical protein KSS87_002374 [Heliosperma pusillum]|nr:hypothetical protein KSS87_002374 [Heliosperma pusillum]
MASDATSPKIPTITLNHGGVSMPVLGLGMAPNPAVPDEVTKNAVLEAVEVGYRHFDTATIYFTENALGEGISEVLRRGMPLPPAYPIKPEDFRPFDYKGVWAAMEECQKLGLTKAIGVSNFTPKKLEQLLATATIPPAVNQVEVNPTWQQKELIEFCKTQGIVVTAYSPLGGPLGGHNGVMESNLLKEIAHAKGKTVAQVALRWAYELGITVVVKSFNKGRMKQNLEIFDWELSPEDHEKISSIPQARTCSGLDYTSPFGPFRTVEELWDEEV